MTETLRVLLALEVVGLAALPLAQLALGRMALGGVAFAKPLGLVLVAWLVWMGTVAGLRNTLWLAIGASAVVAVAGLAAWPVVRRKAERRIPWRRLAAMEALFAVAFLLCALYNAYSPDVWQTEKPMDMAFVNATIASPGNPPHDPWMAGEDLNYYYFGHLIIGVLVRLTDVEPSRGYNLALAVLFALAVVTAFGLAAALVREAGRAPRSAWLGGAAAVVLLVIAGTPGGGLDALGAGDWARFGWFGASRVIPGTINEFPFFSYLLGDLHAHVIAGPLTLTALAFVAQAALHGPPRGLGFWERALAALSIGTLYAINSWSFPVCAGLFIGALAIWARSPESAGRRRSAAVHAIVVIGLSLAAVAPFLAEFKPNARGVGGVHKREKLGDFLAHEGALYGTLAWAIAALYLGRVRRSGHPWRVLLFAAAAAVVSIPLLAEVDFAGPGILLLLLATAVPALASRAVPRAERVMWLFVAGALVCLVIGEVVYVRDEFDHSDLFRMNTVFKMGYQAWYLLAVAGGCAVAMAPEWLPRLPRWIWRIGLAALVVVGCAFSVVASYARKASFAGPATLEGRRWLPPDDVAAIDWLRAHTPGDAVVLESVGDDYSAFGNARISVFTGRATVMGWEGHEVQWRHSPGNRRALVQEAYASRNPTRVRQLIAQLGFDYAVVGRLERTDYGDARALEILGHKVFQSGETAVYAYAQPKPTPEPQPEPAATPRKPVLGGG